MGGGGAGADLDELVEGEIDIVACGARAYREIDLIMDRTLKWLATEAATG